MFYLDTPTNTPTIPSPSPGLAHTPTVAAMADSEPAGDEPGSSSSPGAGDAVESEEKSAEASLVPRESGHLGDGTDGRNIS